MLTANAQSYDMLLATRFMAGIGLGGATPCFIALASEYAPKRRRAMVASLIWAAFPVSGTVGGFLNSYILAHYGCQNLFYIGGILPLAVMAALIAWLPESLRFLLARNADPGRISVIVRKIDPQITVDATFVADEERVRGAPLRHLFTEGRTLDTVLL